MTQRPNPNSNPNPSTEPISEATRRSARTSWMTAPGGDAEVGEDLVKDGAVRVNFEP